eukprot:2799165-Prymnesium_polylepis.1
MLSISAKLPAASTLVSNDHAPAHEEAVASTLKSHFVTRLLARGGSISVPYAAGLALRTGRLAGQVEIGLRHGGRLDEALPGDIGQPLALCFCVDLPPCAAHERARCASAYVSTMPG